MTTTTEDIIVGYYWTSEAGHLSSYHCLQHRPTPPDDGTPVMACDVTDEACEDCGKRLDPLPSVSEQYAAEQFYRRILGDDHP